MTMNATLKKPSVARRVRDMVANGGERLWRLRDFEDLPATAVAQTLSRMARQRELRRLKPGLYYRARKTAFGESRPSPATLQAEAAAHAPLFPAGLSAANLLGLSTQIGRAPEVATTATSLPKGLLAVGTVVHTRRPQAWEQLTREEAAMLDVLRHRGQTSELSPSRTIERTIDFLSTAKRYARLTKAALSEPPRVRAILGALGDAIGATSDNAKLLQSLNPLSRFDFGKFSSLATARAWQADT